MSTIFIDNLNDPRILPYRQIKNTNETRNDGLFVLEGQRLLDRILGTMQFPLHSVLAAERKQEAIAARLDDQVPLYVLPNPLISELVGYNFHQGVLACGVERAWPSPTSVVRDLANHSKRVTLIACPAMHNPENLGSLVRIADVFGASGVLAGAECPDPLSRRVLRVSMGTVLNLPVWRMGNLAEVLESLRTDLSVELVAAETVAGAIPLSGFHRPDRMTLLLGNEAHGLSADWLRRSDRQITIPMRPHADSLNVSVTAGILLYHLLPQST